jgi:hypothetical protein
MGEGDQVRQHQRELTGKLGRGDADVGEIESSNQKSNPSEGSARAALLEQFAYVLLFICYAIISA